MKLFQILIRSTIFTILFIGCTDHSSQINEEQPKILHNVETQGELRQKISKQYSKIQEFPKHIKHIENLSIFSDYSTPLYDAELILVQTYGKSEEYYLTEVYDFTVDDNLRVIILNRGSNYAPTLQVFNDDGTYFTQIGRRGRGPGEYLEPFYIQAQASRFYLYDLREKRINVYDTDDYTYIKSSLEERWDIRTKVGLQGYTLGGMYAKNDGNILVNFYKPLLNKVTARERSSYYLMDLEGEMIDFNSFTFSENLRLSSQNTSALGSVFPLGRTLVTISNYGELIVANTQEFMIKKYDSNGTYESAFYYPLKGNSLDLEVFLRSGRKFGPSSLNIDDVVEAFRDIDEELPKYYPIVDKLIVDDKNRIWVAVPIGVDYKFYEWWILNENGELLSKVILPLDQPIFEIKMNFIYCKITDAETGTDYVVKYRLDLTNN